MGAQQPKVDAILAAPNLDSSQTYLEKAVASVVEDQKNDILRQTVISDDQIVENESDREDYDLANENDDISYSDEDSMDTYGDTDSGSDLADYNEDTPSIEETSQNDNKRSSKPSNNHDNEENYSSRQVNMPSSQPLQRSSRLDKIAAMKLEVEEEARKKLMAQMGLNLDSVKILWESYRKDTSSMSTMAALSNCMLDYKDKNIKVIVPNASTKGIVMQEHRLMDEIREKFGLQDITLEVNVDPSLFPDIEVEEINKKLSPKEIHQLFAKKNPNFEKLIQDLKLKNDNGSFS